MKETNKSYQQALGSLNLLKVWKQWKTFPRGLVVVWSAFEAIFSSRSAAPVLTGTGAGMRGGAPPRRVGPLIPRFRTGR